MCACTCVQICVCVFLFVNVDIMKNVCKLICEYTRSDGCVYMGTHACV